MIKTKVAAAASTETPEEKAAREAEQARAEAQQIDETQGLLQSDTRRRARRFGVLGSNPFGGTGSGGASSGLLQPGAFSSGGVPLGLSPASVLGANSSSGSRLSALGRGKLLAE